MKYVTCSHLANIELLKRSHCYRSVGVQRYCEMSWSRFYVHVAWTYFPAPLKYLHIVIHNFLYPLFGCWIRVQQSLLITHMACVNLPNPICLWDNSHQQCTKCLMTWIGDSHTKRLEYIIKHVMLDYWVLKLPGQTYKPTQLLEFDLYWHAVCQWCPVP